VIDFRENCQKMVASFHSPSQIFEIVPYALTLITADRHVNICWLFMDKNKSIYAIYQVL